MRPARIILLLVALVAGGLAAYLATRGDGEPAPAQVTTTTIAEPVEQVLVAATEIGVAERLSVTNVSWQAWPEGALRSDYVTRSSMPDAPQELTGTVARFEFFTGEPIRESKLVRAEQGYLSAVLTKGMRGVSIPVAAASGSGGFIVPNDRVDVILTRGSAAGDISETILANVKVLAIGQRLGEVGTTGAPADPENPRAEVFTDRTIATLELDPGQAETLINSVAIGQLSLALRSVADFNDAGGAPISNSNQPIRLIRYGAEASVLAGTGSSSDQPRPPPVAAAAVVETAPLVPGVPAGALPISTPATGGTPD